MVVEPSLTPYLIRMEHDMSFPLKVPVCLEVAGSRRGSSSMANTGLSILNVVGIGLVCCHYLPGVLLERLAITRRELCKKFLCQLCQCYCCDCDLDWRTHLVSLPTLDGCEHDRSG